jgi:hypothetical protein
MKPIFLVGLIMSQPPCPLSHGSAQYQMNSGTALWMALHTHSRALYSSLHVTRARVSRELLGRQPCQCSAGLADETKRLQRLTCAGTVESRADERQQALRRCRDLAEGRHVDRVCRSCARGGGWTRVASITRWRRADAPVDYWRPTRRAIVSKRWEGRLRGRPPGPQRVVDQAVTSKGRIMSLSSCSTMWQW